MRLELMSFGRRMVAGALLALTLAQPLGVQARALSPAPGDVGAVVSQDAATTLATGLRALNEFAAASMTALAANDPAAARAAYQLFDTGWEAIEDGVRDRSRDDYRSIEDAMREVDRGLRADPPDTAQVTTWLQELQNRVNQFISTLPAS